MASDVILPWDQVARVVDRPRLQRLELLSADGFVVIGIENQLEDFDRLREIVLEQTDWENIEDVPTLPATFSRTLAYLIVVAGVAVVFVGPELAAALAGHLGGVVLIPLGLALLFDWFKIRVYRTGVTFHHLLWKKTIPVDDIEEVTMETLRPGHGNALLAVSVRMRNGKARRISAVHGGVLSLYRTLLAVVRPES